MSYTYQNINHWQGTVETYFEINMDSPIVDKDLILPDGTNGILFIQNGELIRTNEQGKHVLTANKIYLFGQKTRAVSYQFQSFPFRACGFKIAPHALSLLFDVAGDLATDNVLHLTCVQKRFEKIANLLSDASLKNQLFAFMEHCMYQDRCSEHPLLESILQYIHQQIDKVNVKLIINQFQLTYKSLARLFKKTIGITPKLYIRIIRFNSCINLLAKNKYKRLTDVAYEAGYFDQNHFIKEIKYFTGQKPSQLFNSDVVHLEPQQLNFIVQQF